MNQFCTSNPLVQRAWDAYSLSQTICWRKYEYAVLKGYSRSAAPLDWGIAFHHVLQAYLKARPEGREVATNAAVRMALECTWPEIPSLNGEDKRRTRWTLVRASVWYDEQYGAEEVRVLSLDGKPAIETSFRIPTEPVTPDGDPYLLVGYLDAILEVEQGLWLVDFKHTTKSLTNYYWDQFFPNTQMSLYNLAKIIVLPEAVKGVMLLAAQIGVGFCRFDRKPIYRTRAQSEEFTQTVYDKIAEAKFWAEQGRWPMDEEACGLFGGCSYRDVCRQDPALRGDYLKRFYKVRKWNPLDER